MERTRLFLECLEDWIGEDNPVRVIDVFVDERNLAKLGFSGVDPEPTGRLSYRPSVIAAEALHLRLFQSGPVKPRGSSVRPDVNIEVIWLTGCLVPDHKTIADFRKDDGRAIRHLYRGP